MRTLHRVRAALSAIALAAVAGSAGAQGIVNEQVLVPLPDNAWQMIGSARTPGALSILEYAPPGQTAENWTRRLKIEIFHNNSISVLQLAAQTKTFHDTTAQICDSSSFTVARQVTVNGYEAIVAFITCPRHKASGRGEFTLWQAMRGTDALYIVQRQMRGQPFAADALPLDEAEVREWVTHMARVSLCDSRAPQHPCPTATRPTP